VHDPEVLALLAEIHREDYVPAAHRAMAFFDMELPLADATEPGQTMLAPKIEARMLNDLHVQKHESVLEIGTGSGFMAALLAHRAAQVLTLEIDATLAARATETLRRNGVTNVEVRHADGAQPLPSGPTFDVIVLSGSVARVPQNLMGSLNIGGRLVAIVGGEPMMRAHFVTRVSEGKWETTQPWDTIAPRLLNFPEPSPFRF
jgi:protein-L-isoaspartate(D-aspartate) O-methyltransferase